MGNTKASTYVLVAGGGGGWGGTQSCPVWEVSAFPGGAQAGFMLVFCLPHMITAQSICFSRLLGPLSWLPFFASAHESTRAKASH